VTAFREILPGFDLRRILLSAVGSVLKWFFITALLLDVEELHRTVDKMHKTEGDITQSVNYKIISLHII
jgi:hypothetical protein